MDRIALIREEERNYHEPIYRSNPLFAEGTWLHKPVKTVMDLMRVQPTNETQRRKLIQLFSNKLFLWPYIKG